MTRRWAPPTPTTWLAMGIATAAALGTATYLAANYRALPYGVPVRFVGGLPLIYQEKTPLVVMLPAAVQLALLAVFGALILLLLWRAQPSAGDANQRQDADGMRMQLAAEGIALLAVVWIGVQALGAVRLMMLWRGGVGGYGSMYSLAMAAAVVASVVIAVRTMRRVGHERRKPVPTDPAVWRLRQLYFNPRDPALFVATRTGVGWTLNFGRPLAILLLAATLLIGIGAPYVLARYVLRAFTW